MKPALKRKGETLLFCLSFYNLDYGIGASASFIDQLNCLPPHTKAVVVEPNRVDLPKVNIELSSNFQVARVPIPLTGALSLLYPLFAFLYGLKILPKLKPDLIFGMHQPFHTLALTSHMLSVIFRIPCIIDVQDVWRPMGQKISWTIKLNLIKQAFIEAL